MSDLTPPPRIISEFTSIWKEWLRNLYNFIVKHTGGTTPTTPATGTSWNAHGNTATGTTTSPLKIDAGALWVDGGDGDVPTSGAGSRLMWIPKYRAFRAGRITGTYPTRWDDGNIGTHSVAIGRDCQASGGQSVSLGDKNVADGNFSVAIGNINTTNSERDVAIGYNNTSTSLNFGAICIGDSNTATEDYAFSIGQGNDTAANSGVSLGSQHTITSTAINGVSIGYGNTVSLQQGIAIGSNVSCTAPGNVGIAIGKFVDANNTNTITLGIGASGVSYLSNNITNSIMMGVGSTTPTLTLVAGGVGVVTTDPKSTLDIGSSVGYKTEVISSGATTTLGSDDFIMIVNAGQNHTLTLPSITDAPKRTYYIKNINGAFSTTIAVAGGTSDRLEIPIEYGGGFTTTSLTMASNDTLHLVADTNTSPKTWWVI